MTWEQYANDYYLPYWAERWPSSSAFFSFITQHPISEKKLILELGCGLGVIASPLAASGHYVVATDVAPQGCRVAAYNIAANNGVPRVVCADWRHLPVKARFDCIVASDVLYEERWINPILDCIDRFLGIDGFTWIADPCRRFWDPFKRHAIERGFLCRSLERIPDTDSPTIVEILEITRT